MKIVEMNPNILEIVKLYLQKLESLNESERKVLTDTLKLYIYPKYIIEGDKNIDRIIVDSCSSMNGHEEGSAKGVCKNCGTRI